MKTWEIENRSTYPPSESIVQDYAPNVSVHLSLSAPIHQRGSYVLAPLCFVISTSPYHTLPLPPDSAYHPFLVNAETLPTTSLNPSLNLFRHLWLFSLFLFNPGLSWNRCLLKSALTLFRARSELSWPNPRTRSRPLDGSRSMLRPVEASRRGYFDL